jgi:hypothetical protein
MVYIVLWNKSNGYMPYCGSNRWDESIERGDVVNSIYLTSIWAIRLFNKHCDICKDIRLEIPVIHSRNHKSWIEDLKAKS